ncbi:MAG: Fic family protein [Chloroflexota bacterium]|nr:Fic family protein [Dehalococcoidia bacterium]MDW8255092.1 Fic family protein [Chloroflexota bacterium]
MGYRYLSADELVALQRRLGGSSDVDADRLDALVARPALAAQYDNADLIRQAALLVAGIVCLQPFPNGNRRLALVAGDLFIAINGFRLTADLLEFADQIVNLPAALEEAADTLEAWLRRRVRFDG